MTAVNTVEVIKQRALVTLELLPYARLLDDISDLRINLRLVFVFTALISILLLYFDLLRLLFFLFHLRFLALLFSFHQWDFLIDVIICIILRSRRLINDLAALSVV